MKIGIIGGSNSVIRGGYVQNLQQYLKDTYELEVKSIANLAVGATTVFTGLSRLVQTKVHMNVDVLLVEYALNDINTFHKRPHLWDDWARGFEGMIRVAKSENPNLIVIPIILVQKNGPHRRGICWISSSIEKFCDYYVMKYLNIADHLRREEKLGVAELYLDESHFSIDVGVPFILKCLGSVISEALDEHELLDDDFASLPKPIYPDNFSHAQYIKFGNKFFATPPVEKAYKNSFVSLNAYTLKENNEFGFRISGRVLLMDYVSTKNSATLSVSNGLKSFLQNTTRATFEKQNFDFLISTLLPRVHGDYDIKGFKAEYSFKVSGDKGTAVEGEKSEASSPVIPPLIHEDLMFAVSGAFYCGQLVPKSFS